ncbi:MAG: hydroxymethylpyrimidine/phosphomethylpyrimidine kinase [Gammaproteobacteria bacterium]|nr:hydroxymethylpyrimidine/phosphomethylpyrimidine kinase [Gammaproteobacteria bacterium]
MTNQTNKPVVLCFSGLDPTGGAGIQADIEAIAAQSSHAAPVVTALTVQDTNNVKDFAPVKAEIIIQQARAVLEDMPVAAIKLGMLGSAETAEAIHSILTSYPDIPVIFDPVLAAGGGASLSQQNLIEAIQSLLLPLCYLVTPNTHELHKLTAEADTDSAAAMQLLDMGTEYVLVTGSHADTKDVQHHLFGNFRCLNSFSSERLEHEYHGSGCTLTSAIAGLLAQGHDISQAIRRAQNYTLQSLKDAHSPGSGQLIPNRFYWNK